MLFGTNRLSLCKDLIFSLSSTLAFCIACLSVRIDSSIALRLHAIFHNDADNLPICQVLERPLSIYLLQWLILVFLVFVKLRLRFWYVSAKACAGVAYHFLVLESFHFLLYSCVEIFRNFIFSFGLESYKVRNL